MPNGISTASKAARNLPDFVEISVRVATDRMSAYICLCPIAGAKGTLTTSHLRAALERDGVTRGIDAGALKIFADDYNRSPREIETLPIARGKPAAPIVKSGTLKIAVRYLSAPADVARLLDSKYFWQVAPLAAKFQRVDRGTILAKRTVEAPHLLGHDVFGAPVMPNFKGAGEAKSGSILQQDNVITEDNAYTAAVTGIAYVDKDGAPKVHPIIFDAMVEVTLSPDHISAELTLSPPGERGGMPSECSVRDQLKHANVLFGIDEEAVRDFLARFAAGNNSTPQTCVIARGISPVKGEDGRVEFCFNTESVPTPHMNPDGSADYKDISIVNPVEAGTLLAKLIPPSKGKSGKDVTGSILPALYGTRATLPAGANTIVSPEDPTALIAATKGIVGFDGNSVSVSDGYIIEGDVDYSTGNVRYDGSVGVNGDVKSGFNVQCGGNLQVNGSIEDCIVTVKDHVLCQHGFVGTGKGIINAAGNVNLVYVKNQTVIAGGTVNIAQESINSNITARKSIKIHGRNISVIGGIIAAHESIIIKTAGNISGVRTLIQIVPDPELAAQIDTMQTTNSLHKENIKKLITMLDTLPPAQKTDKDFVQKIKNTITSIKHKIVGLDEEMRALSITMNNYDNSYIRIERCAYPGTVFTIGQRNMVVRQMLNSAKTLKLVGQEIKVL